MRDSRLPVLCLVIPCFNESLALHATISALSEKIKSMVVNKLISHKSKIVFVDDGSNDNSYEILYKAAKKIACCPPHPRIYEDTNIVAIKLSANVGHQNALLAGLWYVRNKCDCCISIDCDLQDDIHVLDEFIKRYNEGNDIVYGVRKSRNNDTFFKKYSALAFYKLMSIMGVRIVYDHADYRLLSNKALKSLLTYKETYLFLRGMVPLLGYKSAIVKYDRLERVAGDSKYPLRKMLSFAINGITSFSVVPLRIVSCLGIVFFILSILLGCYVLYVKLFTNHAVSGWASIIVLLCFFSGIQLLSLGVIGEYIGKTYIQSKQRPKYFIEEIASLD